MKLYRYWKIEHRTIHIDGEDRQIKVYGGSNLSEEDASRNALAKVPKSKRSQVAAMLKAIHAMESREAASAKAESVATELESMKLKEAAKVVCEGFAETLT